MEDITQIHITDYDYNLPEERIAKHPLPVRDQSKLLLFRSGEISHTIFQNLPNYLPSGSLMVFNNTRVIQARLYFHKDTGALVEIFCLEPFSPKDYERIFNCQGSCEWVCLIGNRKKWKNGVLQRTLPFGDGEITLFAEQKGEEGTGFVVRFSWDRPEVTFSEILNAAGELPIPPYLNRPTEESDLRNYQTVYSKIKGSVAAPTAGLHFTEDVLKQLDACGIERNEITLHVGAGTFKPVKSETIAGHEMHSEYISVSLNSVNALLRHDGQCTAVGTTAVRTLESLYYIGEMLLRNPDADEEQLRVSQWQPYASEGNDQTNTMKARAVSHEDEIHALEAIRDWMQRNSLCVFHTQTQIIIVPGYRYHYVKRIITNFHMPKSTLLLLVSAFIGDKWHEIYDYALANDFRFLSYGDSSLLIP